MKKLLLIPICVFGTIFTSEATFVVRGTALRSIVLEDAARGVHRVSTTCGSSQDVCVSGIIKSSGGVGNGEAEVKIGDFIEFKVFSEGGVETPYSGKLVEFNQLLDATTITVESPINK